MADMIFEVGASPQIIFEVGGVYIPTYSKAEVDAKDALKANQATTYTKTETDTALALKANKTQEAWITPTLLNGWVVNGLNPQYRKDTLGKITVNGRLSSGTINTTGTGIITCFVLPIGYRPLYEKVFTIPHYFSNTTGVFSVVFIKITTSGDVQLHGTSGSTQRIILDGVSFFTD